jgi:hypothetical protein
VVDAAATAVAGGRDAAVASVGDTGPRAAATAGGGAPDGVVAAAAAALLDALPPLTPGQTCAPLTLAAYALDGRGRRLDLLSDAAATAPVPPPALAPPSPPPLTLASVRSPADAAVAASVAAGRASRAGGGGGAVIITLRPSPDARAPGVRRATLYLAAASPCGAEADVAALVELARAAAAPSDRRPRVLPWRSGGPLTRALAPALTPGGAAALLLHVGSGVRDAERAVTVLALGVRVRER